MARSVVPESGRRARLHSPARRRLLGALPLLGAAPAVLAQQPAEAAPSSEVRLALLIGNRQYPTPFDLPPVHKNVRDLQAVLEKRHFKVTTAVDLEPAALRQAIQAFAQQTKSAPPDATVLYYFTGHGMQVDAENLMLGAGVPPNAKEDLLLQSSLHLKRDVIELLPHRASGMTIAVVDACRQPTRSALLGDGGLNQVEAPLGCLIVFSTAAGKPAIAPSVETLNTFYTASLVKVLASASDELTFSDLFRLVKIDVQQTMLNHPVAAIRALAQFPFIAENTQVRVRLAPRPPEGVAPAVPRFSAEDEARQWKELEESIWPAEVSKLSATFIERYPKSPLLGSAEVQREGAGEGLKALQRNDVRLYRSAFQPRPDAPPAIVEELRKAGRGDKDAAARLARMHLNGENGMPADQNRYEGWMQYAAALGNGIACYELALRYRRLGQAVPAAQYEARAKDLGYTPPPTLDNVRK